jgi:hypothetical protein
MTTQKTIAIALDNAADRAADALYTPATGRQCWYLAKLMADVGDTDTDAPELLTKRDATKLIDWYLAGDPKRTAA